MITVPGHNKYDLKWDDKKAHKNIRDQIKKINVSVNGESLRVASKSKNDLQLAIKLVSKLEESLNMPLKAINFR